MTRGLLMMVTAAAGTAVACVGTAAADPERAVSLVLVKASAQRWDKDIHFHCDVTLDNASGGDLETRTNFSSVFDGLELVVTTTKGKVLAQQGYTIHQSPFSQKGRVFSLKQGKTEGVLVFPITGLPDDVHALKVRLVGTLPGSSYKRILSSETLAVEVKERGR